MSLNESFSSFKDWCSAVDHRLQDIYCITLVDAGIDDERLIDHWTSYDTPSEFVGWFGTKYDLDTK
ncbi:hypothetical protein BH10PSE11_BH10PSE11_34210 [soil metagenome]